MEKFSKNLQALPDGERVVRLYTDGGCSWKTRLGAWAYLICDRDDSVITQNTGVVEDTTISRMEMTALIEGLRSLCAPHTIEVVSDSQYLTLGISTWMPAWRIHGWKVANSDLWKILFELCGKHQVFCTWIRGHSGVAGNEICDELCKNVIKEYKSNANRSSGK